MSKKSCTSRYLLGLGKHPECAPFVPRSFLSTYQSMATLFSRRRLGVHEPPTDLRLARLGVQPPHLARRPPYRLENNAWQRCLGLTMNRSSRCNKEQNNEHLRLRLQNQIKILKKILGLRIIQFDGQAQ